MPAPANSTHDIILFDGVCNLCSRAVQFILKRDPRDVFRFASLQSPFAQRMLAGFSFPASMPNTIVLVAGGKAHTKSTAALLIARRLPGAWRLLYYFIFIPPFIRDAVYAFIAANRYRWFGKKDACWLPTAALRQKFLDQ